MYQRGYMDSNIENQLIRILNDLNKVDGIGSSLIADNNGNVICHNMSRRADTSLFGPMAHVIMSSSKRLLNSANQGEIQRVLVESYGGKALFLHLGNTYFITLMELSANVGLVMVSAKRAAMNIMEITRDMVPIVPVEEKIVADAPKETPAKSGETEISQIDEITEKIAEIESEISELSEKSEVDKNIESEELDHEDIKETVDKITETEDLKEVADKVIGSEKLDEIVESEEFKALDAEEAKEKLTDMLEIETESKTETEKTATAAIESEDLEISKESKIRTDKTDISPEIEGIETGSKIEKVETQEEVQDEIEEPGSVLPVIRPPISFPKLPEGVKIPDGDKEKSDLVLDIYETIFLAMSIGASKIMGVAPARGLIKRFLPLKDCKILLKDVDVKSNSAIDFDKIRENAEIIPLNERENTLITDFSRIITIITENYGKVMGYGAFRGIVRTEFKIINNSYGKAMGELGIKDKIHPELVDLFK